MFAPRSPLFDAQNGGGSGSGGGSPTLMSGTPPAGGTPPAAPPAAGGTPPSAPPTGDAGTSVPFWKGLYAEDGKLNHANFDRLPERFRFAGDIFKKYPTLESLMEGAANAFTLVGKKGLTRLPENAPDAVKAEHKARLREVLGVPDKPEGYGVKRPENVPEDQWNDDYVNGMIAIMHEHNASPELVKALLAKDVEFAQTTRAGHEASRLKSEAEARTAHEAEVGKLRTELGVDFARRVALSGQVARSIGLNPDDPAIGDNPAMIRAMLRVAEMTGEDSFVTSGKASSMTPAAEAEDIVKNKGNPDHSAYWNRSDPRHKLVVAKVLELAQKGVKKAS